MAENLWHTLSLTLWLFSTLLLFSAGIFAVLTGQLIPAGTGLFAMIFVDIGMAVTGHSERRLLCAFLLVFEVIFLGFVAYLFVSGLGDFYNCKHARCEKQNEWLYFVYYILILVLLIFKVHVCNVCVTLINSHGLAELRYRLKKR